ncbi:phosphonate C-P lyase system protein PhnL [Sneathiella sp.]|jgi:alpha-D-ribose 1-methylphosphonate 5-triphosphate synthase subunit PhnL|uniref:phosphonate C-P lyase system protein PhnL n=1 Tax=Sneathiella sp. TaxID=1964365 RepID=UPI0039E45C4B
MTKLLHVEKVSKSFTLHTQGGTTIPVFKDVDFQLSKGDCIALTGNSGAGKSTFMRMIYANYLCSSGTLKVNHKGEWVDLRQASPHQIIEIRKMTMGYVSQFLRVIPRVSTLEIVSEPLQAIGVPKSLALEKAQTLLSRLNIPQRLWSLSPLTFSGGEQQRVNLARGFIYDYPLMLLDEPTASLDANNRQIVLELIEEAKQKGSAILGIFHDQAARDAVTTGTFDVTKHRTEINA